LLPEKSFLATDKYQLRDAAAGSFDAEGKVLKVDTFGGGTWHQILEFNTGMFAPNMLYTVEFKYKITDGDDDKILFFIVRDLVAAKNGIITDIGQYTSCSVNEKYKTARIIFRTPENAKDYAFVIHTHGKIKAKVKDVQIFEGFSSSALIKPLPDAKPYEGYFKNLPTGCAEFEVQLPAPSKDAPIVNAADFGVSQTASANDNFKNMQKAIDYCSKVGAAKLVLNKGDYKIYNIENAQPLKFHNLKNFEFDGNSSTLTFWRKHGNSIDIRLCQNVKFTNFNVDWNWQDDPIASLAEAVNVGNTDDGRPFVDIKFLEYDRFPVRDDIKTSLLTGYDVDKKARASGWGWGLEIGARSKDIEKKWLSDNVLRIIAKTAPKTEVGKKIFVQHYYYDCGAFAINDNKNMTLENINVFSCPGHAFLVGGTQQYFQFLNVNIVRRKDIQRLPITCSADHLHFARSCGFFKMICCEFSYGVDDCSNFHDCSGFARKHTENSLLTQNSYGFPKGTKVELRHGDYSPTNFTGTVKETITIDASKRIYEVVFEEKLPEQKQDGFIMFDRSYGTHDLLIKDCYFHDTVCRGILLLSSSATIENCRFERHQMGALKLETGYTFNVWSEGYGVNNVIIRNNKFTDVNLAEHKHGGYARDIFMGVYMKQDPSDVGTMYPIINNILVENNEFNESTGLIAYISSTGNVTFRDNTFINRKPTKSEYPYRGCFYVTYSTNTKIINNTWIKSKFAEYSGVMYDASTTKNLKVEGNRIVEDK